MTKTRTRRRPSRPQDPWTADPASRNDRPTPERQARGDWDLIRGEYAGQRVAIDRSAHLLDRALRAGKLTPGQVDAAMRWHDMRRVVGECVSGPRDSLDDTPRGRAGDFVTQQQIDCGRRLTEAFRALSANPGAWGALVDVVELGAPVGHMDARRSPRWRLLHWALVTLADLWGMDAEK